MARTVAELPAGSRITDYISLGVLTKTFPLDKVIAVVAAAEKTNQRQRDLPAHVVVYYVIALTLYMQVSYREVLRCLLEGVKWLLGPEWEVKVAGKLGISQARARLGWKPLKQLHDEGVAPIAVKRTQGAWYRDWRVVSLDGSTLDVADNEDSKCALFAWWKTGRTYCSARKWAVMERGKSHWPTRYCRRSGRECCVWRIGTFSGSICGKRPTPLGPICCGESKRICAYPVKNGCRTVPT